MSTSLWSHGIEVRAIVCGAGGPGFNSSSFFFLFSGKRWQEKKNSDTCQSINVWCNHIKTDPAIALVSSASGLTEHSLVQKYFTVKLLNCKHGRSVIRLLDLLTNVLAPEGTSQEDNSPQFFLDLVKLTTNSVRRLPEEHLLLQIKIRSSLLRK